MEKLLQWSHFALLETQSMSWTLIVKLTSAGHIYTVSILNLMVNLVHVFASKLNQREAFATL